MFCGSPGVKILIPLAALTAFTAGVTSCGSSSKKTQASSGISFRAFISNPVFPAVTGGTNPIIQIMNASNDQLSNFGVPLVSASASVTDAGMMVVSPKKDRTLLFSPSDTKLAVINNSQESVSTAVTLPGTTEGILVW